VVTGERKAPAVKNGKLRKKKGKKKKGADRWGQCAARERERASDAGEAKQAAAKQQLGRRVGARARVASWATRGSRPVREKEKEKGLGWFGWAKMEEDEFFNVKSFSKSISSISQI